MRMMQAQPSTQRASHVAKTLKTVSVDIEQEHRETEKEEEKGGMNKYRHHPGYLTKIPLVEP